MSWLFLSLSIVCEIVATLSLRASEGFGKKLWILPMAVGYALAFFFLAVTISYGMPVAVAYGIWAAVGVALIALLARLIWKEPLTARMIFGLVLIMAGVLLVEFG